MNDIIVINPEKAKDTQTFIDGSKRTVVELPSIIVGRGEYQPGWHWSKHAGPQTGKQSARHIGWIESGKMIIRAADGSEVEVGPGDAFEVGPGHDAWVVGKEPCIALDFEARASSK